MIIPAPRTVSDFTDQERRYLDVLEFLQSTKTLYRILLNRPNVKRHTKAELRQALYQMDEVADSLTRNSSMDDLDAGWVTIQDHFNRYSAFSHRTRNRR